MTENMLLYTAIGDSYGLSFEFVSDEYVSQHNDALGYKKREKETKGWQDHFPGRFSDDTDCSIAVVQTMLLSDSFEAQTFIHVWQGIFSRDPKRGYSKETKRMLESMNASQIVSGPRNTESNGCLMGAHFLGLYPTKERVFKACVNKCLSMQANPKSIIATTFVAMVAHYLYHHNLDIDTALKQAVQDSGLTFNFDPLARIPCDASITAQAVHKVLSESDNKIEVLTNSVKRGGDVDSVASIALGLQALCSYGEKLPQNFYEELENTCDTMVPTGNYFEELWNRLTEKFPKS
jgi:ADP-ribosyl-[dinitrogen reductase] hydrolase